MAKRKIKASPDGIAMCFIGDGSEFIRGVPMRDLTVEEWEQLTGWYKDAVVNSGLYVPYAPVKEESDR